MKRKAVQKYIPVVLVNKSEKLAEELNKKDYMEYGFLTPPSPNDVLKVALAMGLREIEKMLGYKPKEIIDKKEDTDVKTTNDQNNSKTEKSKNIRKILGDFE